MMNKPSQGKRDGSTAKILIAEDNEINQLVVTHCLAQAGYQYDVVATGVEALRAVQVFHYDLVLMNCQMPEMDGFDATRRVRELELADGNGARHIPIIACTANALQGDEQRCLDAGMDDYVVKPISRDELLKKLEMHLVTRNASLRSSKHGVTNYGTDTVNKNSGKGSYLTAKDGHTKIN